MINVHSRFSIGSVGKPVSRYFCSKHRNCLHLNNLHLENNVTCLIIYDWEHMDETLIYFVGHSSIPAATRSDGILKEKQAGPEWTSFANLSAGIILHVLQHEKCIKQSDIKELASLMSKFVSRKDQDAITDIKLLHEFIDNSKLSWFLEKVYAQMCVQGIIHAIKNKTRSYKGFNLAAWIKCLTKMCHEANILYEILAAEPLDCLYDGISSPIVTEQEATADCLLAIAEKIPGNLKICEHTKIISSLENMQCCEIQILEKKAISVLWYVKQEAIILSNREGDNVLLENENSVKLADFGLAKIVTNSNLPITNQTGTTKWVAPEVLNGSENTPYDCKADIWSLACTVVEMATTNPTWPDHLPEQHMFQLAMGNKPQYLLSEAYSQALHDFLNKMFQYDPEKRPSSLELLNDPYVKWCQSASN